MSQENEVMASEEKQEVTEAKFDGAVADGSSLGGVENLGGLHLRTQNLMMSQTN